ncbi:MULTISPECIES: SCO1664 family protein [Gordonia]|uniref:SCO1664 family protein n=1 Tax=Gordonia cholesterolivorans TaxID=559625 RepID=A0ABP5UT20_9ACTN|nr:MULTISPECIES: SCO1664 family protein [Gordonia]KJR06701.1 phosphatidylinositol kinase [Gordonia sihwensis]KXT56795.1 phosphatidylinositol kinase [Gordonia sp. QH-12]WFN94706.1 SCO1664 family protein [Gordonia sihwensis]
MNADCLELLATGELTVLGRIASASNLTVACAVSDGRTAMRCVYKPVRGEEPLWDFPDGTLAGREVASYLISDALGWDLIPETVLREDGPTDIDLGAGMVQRWIEQPPSDDGRLDPVDLVPAGEVPEGYRGVLNAYDHRGDEVILVHSVEDRLRRLAVLDAVLNNADRKGGHILTDGDGRLYGIDHGICLHSENKLRTILWGWAGTPVPPGERADLARLSGVLEDVDSVLHVRLSTLITPEEIAALLRRAKSLADVGVMPLPPHSRAIPWPPF